MVQIDGFSTVQTSSPWQKASDECIQVIDVARGESLRVEYNNTRENYPGINHKVACEQDRKAAELILHTLKTLTH